MKCPFLKIIFFEKYDSLYAGSIQTSQAEAEYATEQFQDCIGKECRAFDYTCGCKLCGKKSGL